jgi:hypothetical protein
MDELTGNVIISLFLYEDIYKELLKVTRQYTATIFRVSYLGINYAMEWVDSSNLQTDRYNVVLFVKRQ